MRRARQLQASSNSLSLVVTYQLTFASQAAANAAITRGVQWGDGPEDPRGVRVGGKEVGRNDQSYHE